MHVATGYKARFKIVVITCLRVQRQWVPVFWKLSKCLSCPKVHKDREGESSILSPFLDAVAQSDHPSLLSAPQKSYPFILTMLQHDHPSIFSRLQQNICINAPYIFDGFRMPSRLYSFQVCLEEYLTYSIPLYFKAKI